MSSNDGPPINPARLQFPDTTRTPSARIQLQQPVQITSFSYTPKREQEFTDSALRYYVDPPPGAKLDYGFSRWIRKPEDKPRIDSLLKAYSKARREHELGDIGLVSWRGVMTKLLVTPYNYESRGFEINAMCVGDTMYFEEHASDEDIRNKNNMTRRQLLMTYYGYSFESYCTSPTPTRMDTGPIGPGDPPGWGGDVDTHVQWCSVVKSKLGNTRIVIGGEVDCVRGRYTGQPETFVELKTSQGILNEGDADRFDKKLLRFYFQSFLLGVPDIVVGFRNQSGTLTGLQHFQTMQIPRMVRGRSGAWNPLLCMDWGHEALSFIRAKIAEDVQAGAGEESVWRARFVPGDGLLVWQLGRAGVEEVVGGEDRIGFLPRWYWDELCPSSPSDGDQVSGWRI
ncbi:hypothetical protein AX15_002425 [Amanita polypyramis BW_CC]|nr:hypothetical protein AX15_002425 [Amanita polypyramis BW_CC]